jgi:hypothetical protein
MRSRRLIDREIITTAVNPGLREPLKSPAHPCRRELSRRFEDRTDEAPPGFSRGYRPSGGPQSAPPVMLLVMVPVMGNSC